MNAHDEQSKIPTKDEQFNRISGTTSGAAIFGGALGSAFGASVFLGAVGGGLIGLGIAVFAASHAKPNRI